MTRQVLWIVLVGVMIAYAGPAEAQFGGYLNINQPVSGVFTPFLPIDSSGKPFIDYYFMVNQPGTYQIDLRSSNTSSYDPYLVLLSNGATVASNDDGGGGLNSRIMSFLNPGQYTVRVTRFGSGPVSIPVPFTLSITAALAPPQPVYTPPPVGPGLTDALARVLAIQYYTTRSEWAGQYAISIIQTRMVPVSPDMTQVHIQYQYSCIRSQCGGARTGVDQRVFYFQRYGSQWQVVRMGGHMSASF